MEKLLQSIAGCNSSLALQCTQKNFLAEGKNILYLHVLEVDM